MANRPTSFHACCHAALSHLQQELEECKNDDGIANILSKGVKLREFQENTKNSVLMRCQLPQEMYRQELSFWQSKAPNILQAWLYYLHVHKSQLQTKSW